jgi:cytidylate kinase
MTAPLVVVTGPTASGKSTIAAALAAAANMDRVTASDRLVAVLAGRVKADRLRSWLIADTDRRRTRNAEADRATDLVLLNEVQGARRALVVESAALPLLLAPNNTALIVRLAATIPVRAARLRRVLPDLTDDQARMIVIRKDRSTSAALRSAWGIDASAERPGRWRADLVLACPDSPRCPDERACAAAVAHLLAAAYAIYRRHLAGGPLSHSAVDVSRLHELIAADPARVRRCTPLLTDPGTFSESGWRHRLLIELDRNRGTDDRLHR